MQNVTRRNVLKAAVATGAVLTTAGAVKAHERLDDKDENAPLALTLRAAEERVDVKSERLTEVLPTGWASVKLYFGTSEIYRDAVISESSAWGPGNNGRDLWGWKGGVSVHHSDVRRDAAGYYFIYSLQHPVGQSPVVAAQFRYVLRSGAHGVANATFPFPA